MNITESDFLESYKDKKAAFRALKNMQNLLPLRLDSSIARVVSYITFDGHLSSDLRQIYLSSKDKNFLFDFSLLLKDQFDLNGKLEKCKKSWGTSYKYRIFNSSFSRLLFLAGTPKGNKSKTEFLLPGWINKDKEYTRNYLKVAFDCEGSVWIDKNGYPRIRFKIIKNRKLIDNGKQFMESLRDSLKMFDIDTTNIWFIKGNNINDDSVGLCFGIKTKSFKEFAENINFTIEKKNKRLIDITGLTHDMGQT